MTPDRIAECHAVTVALESRIRELVAQRQRDRLWMRATWTPARHARETELRALLAVHRTGRRLARESIERVDPVSVAKAYADWTSGELVAGFGR
jgi:hypothetical protein